MPIVNGKYVNPGWVNNSPPALSASEMNAISDTLEELSQGGGTGGSGKRYARIVIGTSTAGWTASDCDYLCNGTNDSTQFTNAITALPGGGEIVLLDGTYQLNSNVDIEKSCTIRGAGLGANITASSNSTGFSFQYSPQVSVLFDGITFSQNGKISDVGVSNNITFSGCSFSDWFLQIIPNFVNCNIVLSESNNLSALLAGKEVFMAGNVFTLQNNASVSLNIKTRFEYNYVIGTGSDNTFIFGAPGVVVGVNSTNGGVVSNNKFDNVYVGAYHCTCTGNVGANGCTLGTSGGTAIGNCLYDSVLYLSDCENCTGNRVVQNTPFDDACIVVIKKANNSKVPDFGILANNICIGGNVGILLKQSSYPNPNQSNVTIIGNSCSSTVPLQIASTWSNCLVTGNMFPNGQIVDQGSGNIKQNNFLPS